MHYNIEVDDYAQATFDDLLTTKDGDTYRIIDESRSVTDKEIWVAINIHTDSRRVFVKGKK